MTQTLKIVMNKIVFNKNGDSPGKSETYWNLMVDDQVINSRSRDEARKTGDGDIVVIGDSGTVTKADNASLTVLGDVADVDGFLKGGDDKGSFKHVYCSFQGTASAVRIDTLTRLTRRSGAVPGNMDCR
jgi:hypothetical protein